MAYPPNYAQERKSREARKARKAQAKQARRDETSADRKPAAPSLRDPGAKGSAS
jgi:hypothetical protein